MELLLIFRVLRRRWWLALIPVVIVGLIVGRDLLTNRSATSGGFSTVIRYSAAQELDALPERSGDYQDIWLASELTVNALTAWVQTGSFKQEVAQKTGELGLEIDPAALGVNADNERSIGQLFLSWPDETQLQIIAQAAVGVLQTRSQTYFPQLGSQPARVTVLDVPVIVPAAPPIADRFAPFIRLGLGLLIGVALAFLAEYLDTTVRTRQDIESLGLAVIATIPHEKR